MRAWRYHGPGDLRLEEVPDPAPGPGEVLVRPRFNGLCGTDVHQFVTGPLAPVPLPVGMGHETVAEVVEVGAGVAGLAAGDRVAVEPVAACGSCRPCGRGWYHLCRTAEWFGLTGGGGGLAELAVVQPAMAHRLPDGLDLMTGALVEPLSVAHHGVGLADAGPDDLVVVLGAGPIGIGTYLALRAHGVERVVVSEPSPVRRAAMAALGAQVVDPGAVDVAEVVAELGAGEGADVVVEAAGTPEAFRTAVDVLGARGRLVLVAAHIRPVELHPLELLMREVQIRVSFASCGDFPHVVRHLADGAYSTQGWVERVPFDGLVDALQRLHAGEANKVLVEIGM